MQVLKVGTAMACAMAAAACSQGNSDNVMSPEANALEPADVNAALGTDVTMTPDANMSANDMNAVDNSTTETTPPNEPTANNSY